MPRCFIAIELPEDIKKELTLLQKECAHENVFVGKYVEPENLHLTLAFLGNVASQTLAQIRNELKKISFKPFELMLAEIGFFTPENPHVLWVALNGAPVFALQQHIQTCVGKFVILDTKPFTNHVTLARIKHVHNRAKLADLVRNLCKPHLKFLVKEFTLNESQLTCNGPVYSTIEHYQAHE